MSKSSLVTQEGPVPGKMERHRGTERQSPWFQGNRPCHLNSQGMEGWHSSIPHSQAPLFLFSAAFAQTGRLSLCQTLLLGEPSRKGGRGRRGGSKAWAAQGPASTSSKSVQESWSHGLPPTCWLVTLSSGSGQLPPTGSRVQTLQLQRASTTRSTSGPRGPSSPPETVAPHGWGGARFPSPLRRLSVASAVTHWPSTDLKTDDHTCR